MADAEQAVRRHEQINATLPLSGRAPPPGWSVTEPAPILGMLDPLPAWHPRGNIRDALTATGSTVFSPVTGEALRDFATVPHELVTASMIEVEAYMRVYPEFSYVDMNARLPASLGGVATWTASRGNLFNMRRKREVRQPLNARAWLKKHAGHRAPLLDVVQSLSQDQLDRNTTWVVTLNGIHPPTNPAYVLPIDTFLHVPGIPHTPSTDVQEALTLLQAQNQPPPPPATVSLPLEAQIVPDTATMLAILAGELPPSVSTSQASTSQGLHPNALPSSSSASTHNSAATPNSTAALNTGAGAGAGATATTTTATAATPSAATAHEFLSLTPFDTLHRGQITFPPAGERITLLLPSRAAMPDLPDFLGPYSSLSDPCSKLWRRLILHPHISDNVILGRWSATTSDAASENTSVSGLTSPNPEWPTSIVAPATNTVSSHSDGLASPELLTPAVFDPTDMANTGNNSSLPEHGANTSANGHQNNSAAGHADISIADHADSIAAACEVQSPRFSDMVRALLESVSPVVPESLSEIVAASQLSAAPDSSLETVPTTTTSALALDAGAPDAMSLLQIPAATAAPPQGELHPMHDALSLQDDLASSGLDDDVNTILPDGANAHHLESLQSSNGLQSTTLQSLQVSTSMPVQDNGTNDASAEDSDVPMTD